MTDMYVHSLLLDGDDNFTKQFNYCSELFRKALDITLGKEEQDDYWKKFIEERGRLEFGIY